LIPVASDSPAESRAARSDGGGLRNGDDASLTGSIVSSNTAAGAVGGGGIYNTSGATLTIMDTVLGFNTAEHGDGGGLRNSGAATLTDTTASNNQTLAGNGGGLHVTGSATLNSVTLSANISSGNGGGATVASGGDATLTVTNSTFSGNEATDVGGGIAAISGSTVDLTHVTIAQNTASSGGGINAPTNTVVSAQGSIVSGNTGADCAGTVASADHNLDSDGSCAFAEATDLSAVDPLLQPLDSNGGPTQTHALPAASPAVNAAEPNAAPARDQRGVLRPVLVPDIGAFERSIVDLDITIEPIPDNLRLRDLFDLRLAAGNKGPDGAQGVQVTADLPASVEVEGALPPGCKQAVGRLTCDLDDIAPDAERATVDLQLRAISVGAVALTFDVVALNTEATPGDNTATIGTTVLAAQTISIRLDPGWSLVSWPGAETPVEDAVEAIVESIDAVFAWDATTQEFVGFRPALPEAFNALKSLSAGTAIWIRVLGTQAIDWQVPAGARPTEITLLPGFNLVAWGAATTAVPDGIAAIVDTLRSLAAWDAGAQSFLSFVPDLPPILNGLQTLEQGQAFWVEVGKAITWTQSPPQ